MISKRIKLKDLSTKPKTKLNYTLTDEQFTHKAILTGIKSLPNGEFVEVHLGTNKVLIGGLRELSYLLYNKRPDFSKPTFEEVLYAGSNEDLNSAIVVPSTVRQVPYVQGFNVGYNGAQGDGVVQYPRHYDGFDFDSLIPFRVIPLDLNNFEAHKSKYLHHRLVYINGKPYIEYYTKRININVKAQFKDGQQVPNDPQVNSLTDLDSRLIAEFPVSIDEQELVEHFRLRKEEGAEGSHYNSTMMMIGNAAEITLDGEKYDTMKNTHVYAKSNHVSVAHGVDAFISVKYQLLHI
ncbi:MAG: hypothetical protein ACRCX2_20765 [Paraclostridium sp.]